jgi:hypothetical protein
LRRLPQRTPALIPAANLDALFVQPAAGWAATLHVSDDELAVLLAA